MGCHTWFYVCLEERQEELRKEYFNRIVNSAKKLLQWYKNEPDKNWIRDFEDYYNSNEKAWWKKQIYPNCKSLPELENWSDKSILEEITLSKIDYWQGYKNFFIESASTTVKCLEQKCHSLEDIIRLLPERLTDEDGLEYIEGKIYIDACSKAAEEYLNEKMSDLFRIYNSNAKNCYSVEDCIQRCAENDVILTHKELKELKEWYKKYPNTLIRFF